MPKKTSRRILFKQDDIISIWNRLGGTNTANKFLMIKNESIDNDLINGLSYGLATEFLIYSASKESIEYINQMKYLPNIINKYNYIKQSPIDTIYLKAKKEHAIALFNKNLINIINTQGKYDFCDHVSDFKLDVKIPSIRNNEDFNLYLDRLYDFNKKNNPNRNSPYWNEFNEKTNILMKKYYEGIFSPTDKFKKTTEREIYNSIGYKYIKKLYPENSEEKDKLKNDLSLYDIATFLDVSRYQVQKDILNSVNSRLINHGLSPTEIAIGSNDFIYNDNISHTTLNKLLDDILISQKSKYYYLFSNTHVIAITIEKDETTGDFTYGLFDADIGIIEFYYFFEFKEYLKKMVHKYSVYYSFRSLKDDDYAIFVREYKLTPETRTLTGLEKIELNDIDITASTLLAQKKIKIKLDRNIHVIFDSFDKKIIS